MKVRAVFFRTFDSEVVSKAMAQAPLLSLIFIYSWIGVAGGTFFGCAAWGIYLFMQPSLSGLLGIVPLLVSPFGFAQIIIAIAAYRGSGGARRFTEISAGVIGGAVLFVGGPIMLLAGPGLVLISDIMARWPIESAVLMCYPALVVITVVHAFRRDSNTYFKELQERKRAPQPYWHALVILAVIALVVTVEQAISHDKTAEVLAPPVTGEPTTAPTD